MRKLRMAASLRPVFLSSGRWFLCVSILESETGKKNGAKIWVADSTGGCCEPEFHVASTSPANRESPLSQTRALKVPDSPTAQIPRGRQVHVTCLWSTGV